MKRPERARAAAGKTPAKKAKRGNALLDGTAKAQGKTKAKSERKAKAGRAKPARASGVRTSRESSARPKTAPKRVASDLSASALIDERIRELGGWRGETLGRMRALIHEAVPDVIEEWKWRGTPVWSRAGILCTGEAYTKVVKLTFAKGAKLPDPTGLFNSSLEGTTRRAIDIHEGEKVDARAFKALIKAAAAENGAGAKGNAKAQSRAKGSRPAKKEGEVVLLSGGNPQIAKGYGDGPVKAYIAALPGWKSELGKRLDALIVRSVPNVRKAVKWNSPFYGTEDKGWFLAVHAFARYIKVTFFRGTSLEPVPPEPSKHKEVRYAHIHEGDELDEAVWAGWAKQAAALPGGEGLGD